VFAIVGGKPVRIAHAIYLSEDQQAQLEAYARGRRVEQRIVERANIILLALHLGGES